MRGFALRFALICAGHFFARGCFARGFAREFVRGLYALRFSANFFRGFVRVDFSHFLPRFLRGVLREYFCGAFFSAKFPPDFCRKFSP